jgi:hypothetical protein
MHHVTGLQNAILRKTFASQLQKLLPKHKTADQRNASNSGSSLIQDFSVILLTIAIQNEIHHKRRSQSTLE